MVIDGLSDGARLCDFFRPASRHRRCESESAWSAETMDYIDSTTLSTLSMVLPYLDPVAFAAMGTMNHYLRRCCTDIRDRILRALIDGMFASHACLVAATLGGTDDEWDHVGEMLVWRPSDPAIRTPSIYLMTEHHLRSFAIAVHDAQLDPEDDDEHNRDRYSVIDDIADFGHLGMLRFALRTLSLDPIIGECIMASPHLAEDIAVHHPARAREIYPIVLDGIIRGEARVMGDFNDIVRALSDIVRALSDIAREAAPTVRVDLYGSKTAASGRSRMVVAHFSGLTAPLDRKTAKRFLATYLRYHERCLDPRYPIDTLYLESRAAESEPSVTPRSMSAVALYRRSR